jgi:hypothetical protein
MAGIPNITPELIEYLESICPDQSPSLTTAERAIWFDAGKADLVRHLRGVFDEQSQNILEGN